MKKISLIFLFVSVLVAAGAYHYFSGDDNRPTSTATTTQQETPTLSEQNHTVIYQPKAGSNEVPMHFDRLDFGGYHRIEYFVENGYIGLSSQKDTIIGNHHLSNGFARLNILFPSADTQSGSICQAGQYDLANSCPMGLITIESNNNYQIAERRKQINAQSPVHQTPPIRKERLKKRRRQEKTYQQTVNDDTVYQWTAFYTQKANASKIHDTWIGWECDSDYLSRQNDNIHSWAEKDNLWPMPPSQIQSSACAQPFSSSERWKMLHFPKLSQLTQHPVLWKCSQYDQECKATFDYHGALKTVTVPSGAIDNQALKPLDRKRHEMIKVAWKLLQTAALRAESKQIVDIAEALQQDLAQCQEIANISRDLLTVSAAHKKQLHTLWDRKRWAVSSYLPVSPCSRAMHRLIQYHDAPAKTLATNKPLTPAVNSLISKNK